LEHESAFVNQKLQITQILTYSFTAIFVLHLQYDTTLKNKSKFAFNCVNIGDDVTKSFVIIQDIAVGLLPEPSATRMRSPVEAQLVAM